MERPSQMLLRRTLRSFLVPTRNSWTAVGSFSFNESSSHCLQTERGNFTQTVRRQTGSSRYIRLPDVGKRANIIDIKRDDHNWNRRSMSLKSLSDLGRFSALLIPHPEHLCSMWKQCIWTSLVLQCPICTTETTPKGQWTLLLDPESGRRRTHSCRLKGTPNTSKRSISKSTPIVAL